MKKLIHYRAIAFLVIGLILFPISGFAEEKQESPSKSQASKKKFFQTIKEKYQEEMEAVKKDTAQAGQDFKKSNAESSAKASEDFKETGTALNNAGKEMKEGAAESWQNLQNLLKKVMGKKPSSPPTETTP